MATPVTPIPGQVSQVTAAGTPVQVAVGGANGGLISNPLSPVDQGLSTPQVLYVDPVGPCLVARAGGTIFALQPGETWSLVPGQTTPTNVNSGSSGHKFTVVTW